MRELLAEFQALAPQPQLAETAAEILAIFHGKPAPPQNASSVNETLVEPLSERELEIFRLVNQGLSNSEIAAHLVLSIGTVKTHIHHIFGKLDVRDRPQAIAKARSFGL
jgi:LuxR family maltose regulon positive regulatory protein